MCNIRKLGNLTDAFFLTAAYNVRGSGFSKQGAVSVTCLLLIVY